jgi:hypothetical protein
MEYFVLVLWVWKYIKHMGKYRLLYVIMKYRFYNNIHILYDFFTFCITERRSKQNVNAMKIKLFEKLYSERRFYF